MYDGFILTLFRKQCKNIHHNPAEIIHSQPQELARQSTLVKNAEKIQDQ